MEILTGKFHAGSLGPSTIVGSAAFNLMVITAACVTALPAGETRSIKSLGVFLVTSSFSVIAYVWLLIMVKFSTPEIITLIEAIITCCLMVVLLLIAYYVDTRMGAKTNYRVNLHSLQFKFDPDGNPIQDDAMAANKTAAMWEAARQNGDLPDLDSTPEEIAEKLRDVAPGRSRAYYRHNLLKGGGLTVAKNPKPDKTSTLEGIQIPKGSGAPPSPQPQIVDSTSAPPSPPSSPPGLPPLIAPPSPPPSPTVGVKVSSTPASPPPSPPPKSTIDVPPSGLIRFVQPEVKVLESVGTVTVQVERIGGAQGEVTVDYHTKDQEAIASMDYEAISGTLTFKDGEAGPLDLTITIIDDDDFERDETFTVVLCELKGGAIFDCENDGGATQEICTVTIENDDHDNRRSRFAKAMSLLKVDLDQLHLAEASWSQQIHDVFSLPEGSAVAKAIAIISSPWKFLFALCPPPALWGGWPCFIGALCLIGFQVMLISDFGNQMGCHMGLNPSITAITFVALGTSLPDLFASKQAAIADKTADNSIGNVTGSNSVNVFFGLGVPWLIGAVYWEFQGASDEWIATYPDLYAKGINGGFVVRSGDLFFSVMVFAVFAIITICIILLRRPAELGGSKFSQNSTAAALITMWLLYVTLSSLASIGTITVNI
uniref:Calx-beta domain-containing protein n=2 Tax=Haptolina ericina TaxID=156174 RepID=A0A7S3F9J0_9EUKA